MRPLNETTESLRSSAEILPTAALLTPMNLKPETLQRIDEVITHYPVKRSATLPLLHLIQEDVGHLPEGTAEWVAAKLEIEPINVHGVITFYPMFRQKPIGRRHIRVCRTLSCALTGGYKVCDTLQEEFNTQLGEVSPDGEVTIEFVECLASCGSGPVAMVDDELHERLTPEKARALAAQIRAESSSSATSRRAASAPAAATA